MLTLESQALELTNKALEELKGRKLKSMQLCWDTVEYSTVYSSYWSLSIGSTHPTGPTRRPRVIRRQLNTGSPMHR